MQIRRTLISVGLAIGLIFSYEPAFTQQLVNVNSTLNGDPLYGWQTVNVAEPAGTYLLTEVDPQTDPLAQYTAWDPIGFSSGSTWLSTLWVYNVSPGGETHIATMGNSISFSTPQAAFSDPNNVPIEVTLSTPGILGFSVDDHILYDNLGGISLTIKQVADPVPEPGAYSMLLAGLSLIGFVAHRHKSKRINNSFHKSHLM